MGSIFDVIKAALRRETPIDPLWVAAAGLYPAKALVTQELTRPGTGDEYAVPCYKSVQDISDAQAKLTWTEDPRGGAIDVIKSPRFMEAAIAKHPDFSDDCDGFANHWACALKKSNLAKEIWLMMVFWQGGGHAMCVWKGNDDKWLWASNWNKCQPLPAESLADAFKASAVYRKVEITQKAVWPVVALLKDDSVVYGPPLVA